MPEKRKSSERIIDDLKKIAEKCPTLKNEVAALIKGVKANADAFDVNIQASFLEMVKRRQAAKFYGLSQEAFKAQIAEYVKRQQEIFERAQKLTKSDMAKIEAMKEKGMATKAAKVADLADLLK